MTTSRIWQKVGASAINCGLVLCLSLPLYPFVSVEIWKASTVAIFFLYNICFRARCVGMRMVGTYIEPPTSIWYATLYSLGFSTFFYHVFVPMDLLAVNTTLQVTSLAMTGNTLHGNLAGQGTMSRAQYLERAKGRARLFWLEGRLHDAVNSLITDLDRWPDLHPSDFMVDIGWTLADEGDESGIKLWLEGFQ